MEMDGCQGVTSWAAPKITFLKEDCMAKGSHVSSGGSKSGSGKSGTGGGGRPAPIPPNNGPNPAGWPSTTGNQSGGGRNNGSAQG